MLVTLLKTRNHAVPSSRAVSCTPSHPLLSPMRRIFRLLVIEGDSYARRTPLCPYSSIERIAQKSGSPHTKPILFRFRFPSKQKFISLFLSSTAVHTNRHRHRHLYSQSLSAPLFAAHHSCTKSRPTQLALDPNRSVDTS